MKSLKTIAVIAILCNVATQSFTQNINWASLKSEQKRIVHINAGWDYGLVYGIGYSHKLKTKTPVLLNVSYSFPSGDNIFDDFKTKIGAQTRVFQYKNIQISAAAYGIYRRYENPLVRLQNFGCEMNTVIGFYKPKWFVAGELGFDKAIVTHFKHSESFKNNLYADVKGGWYEPATGGNVNYGIQTGFSVKRSDIVLKIGKVISQDFKTTPLIPYYLQLGVSRKF